MISLNPRCHSLRIILAAALLAACGDSTGPSAPSVVVVVSGNGQAAVVAKPAPNPLVVRVTDADGDPVQGVTVHWAVSSGGGLLSAASSTTPGDGLAQVQWMLGPRAEPQTVTATVQGVTPAVFTVTPSAGPFQQIAITPDSAELTALNQSVALRPSYTDAYGNPVAQPAAVVWTSLDQAVARLSQSAPGEVLAVATGGGRARIVARTVANSRNVADTAVVWVRQQPTSITATLPDGPSVTESDTTRALAVVARPPRHTVHQRSVPGGLGGR